MFLAQSARPSPLVVKGTSPPAPQNSALKELSSRSGVVASVEAASAALAAAFVECLSEGALALA
eukprot:3354416-Pleurochrysis_carterae.AAC.1